MAQAAAMISNCCGRMVTGPRWSGFLPRKGGTGVGLRPQMISAKSIIRNPTASVLITHTSLPARRKGNTENRSARKSEREQGRDDDRQYGQRIQAVLDIERIGEHAAKHDPHAEREIECPRRHVGEAVTNCDQSVDGAGRNAADSDLEEKVHLMRPLPRTWKRTQRASVATTRPALRDRARGASSWPCRYTSWSLRRRRHRGLCRRA